MLAKRNETLRNSCLIPPKLTQNQDVNWSEGERGELTFIFQADIWYKNLDKNEHYEDRGLLKILQTWEEQEQKGKEGKRLLF